VSFWRVHFISVIVGLLKSAVMINLEAVSAISQKIDSWMPPGPILSAWGNAPPGVGFFLGAPSKSPSVDVCSLISRNGYRSIEIRPRNDQVPEGEQRPPPPDLFRSSFGLPGLVAVLLGGLMCSLQPGPISSSRSELSGRSCHVRGNVMLMSLICAGWAIA
jgi:hypothetical protein